MAVSDNSEGVGGGDAPQIDGRRRDDIEREVRERRPYYVDEWTPADGDVGETMLALFAELAEEVTGRLDRVPEKHRVSFFETLGFSRLPPEPARVPVAVTVADRAGENVTVTAGTRAKAEGADGSEQLFEVPAGHAFDATPATLTSVYSLDPDRDAVFTHHDVIGAGATDELFPESVAANRQTHAFYLGDAERLAVGSGSTVTVELATNADLERLDRDLVWEYYGERQVGEESVTGWHAFPSQFGDWSDTDWYPLSSQIEDPATGMHPLPDQIDDAAMLADVDLSDEQEWDRSTPNSGTGHDVLEFTPDGTLEPTTVGGVETNWIRCRIPPGLPEATREELLNLTLDADSRSNTYDQPVRVGASGDSIPPDKLLRNDLPLEESPILPFGERPRQGESFYIASTDALTKTGAKVTISFDRDGGSDDHEPILSWEYFDGSGWSSLAAEGLNFQDDTDNLQTNGEVSFDVPRDLEKTTVAGHEGHWIRVRLVGGDYGEQESEEVPNTDPTRFQLVDKFDPPDYESVRLKYNDLRPPEHAIPENNLDHGPDRAASEAKRYQPFQRLPTDEQSLYLGFDGPLFDGPINLFWDLGDAAYPRGFHPRLHWEYYDAGDETWRRLEVRDGTEGLTERGIVGLVFPESTDSHRAFGEDRHWVRARVTGDPFRVDASEPDEGGSDTERRAGACGRFVETVPPAGSPRRHPPSVRGLHTNVGWTENRRSIEAEVLGSSDGSVDQSATVSNQPVVDIEVWVDELAVLSEGDREALAADWPDRTAVETSPDGDPSAFWVRWERQPDLLNSGPSDRHYVLDPIAGTVSFGDGKQGAVPPRGADNIRATYTTGGGSAGNVEAGAVSGFQQSLPFVESVTNPIPGAAGSDAEETSAVTDRAARQLRDRNRAVAASDFERIAMDSSRQLARVRCLPGMDPDGGYEPGWVTLLVVPDSPVEKPTPSATLRADVEQVLAERAPATLVESEALVVRGPSYVSVSVDATLAATGGSISQLEERATAAIRSYLHPLTGGPDGDGWRFGDLPCRGDLFELLEGIERVDHVDRLAIRFETDRSLVTVTEGQDQPETTADALVYAGTQDVTATLAGTGGGQR